jgi:hypothetical protein
MRANNYEAPELVKVGNVKDLTLGARGNILDAGAGSTVQPTTPGDT